MTQTAPGPIAFTGDGQPIFPAWTVEPGQHQPLGVLADGRPVWPVAPGAGPVGKPQPLGVLSDGTVLFAWSGAAVVRTSTPLWQKKRVLIPAGLVVFGLIGSAVGGESATKTTPSANIESTTLSAPKSAEKTVEQIAADKAAVDKAAADQAAADQASAAKEAADKAAAEKAAAAAEAATNGPRDEQALLQAVVVGRDAYEGTDNELKQRQAQRQRSAALRAAVPGMNVTDWVGEIRTIDTNGEGKGVLELDIGDDTKLGTWNNALSDFQNNTLIPMDSAMYETLVNLKEGDRIRFSGRFFRDEEQGLQEKSLTFDGQMSTPNFVFRFSSISAM